MPICPQICAAISLLREHAPTHTRYVYFVNEETAHNYLLVLAA